jgi:hypothetical protein
VTGLRLLDSGEARDLNCAVPFQTAANSIRDLGECQFAEYTTRST